MEDTFITYKKEIKAKYEQEKTGSNANFLLNPTTGNIRNLAILVFEEITNENDLKIFEKFMGFEYKISAIQNIKIETEKFKPLGTFLKGQTELSNYNAADMLAVILNFNPRPYRNFIKKNSSETDIIKEVNSEKEQECSTTIPQEINEIVVTKTRSESTNKKKKRGVLLGISAGILALSASVFHNVKNTTEKNCMIWNIDHYESVDCDNIKQGFTYSILVPSDEKLLNNFRKIEVDSTTLFFDGKNQPLIWYGKNANKQYEYFTHYGIHPETGKTLKPITNFIINKHIKNNK